MVSSLRHPRTALADYMRSSTLGQAVLRRFGVTANAAPQTVEEEWAEGRPTSFAQVWADDSYQRRFFRYASRAECSSECDFLRDVEQYRAAPGREEQDRICELYIGADALREALVVERGGGTVVSTGLEPVHLSGEVFAQIAGLARSAPGDAKVFDAAAADIMNWCQVTHFRPFMRSLRGVGRG